MKGLAWYIVVLTCLGIVGMIADACEGIDIADSVWGTAAFIPILVFAILYLVKERSK